MVSCVRFTGRSSSSAGVILRVFSRIHCCTGRSCSHPSRCAVTQRPMSSPWTTTSPAASGRGPPPSRSSPAPRSDAPRTRRWSEGGSARAPRRTPWRRRLRPPSPRPARTAPLPERIPADRAPALRCDERVRHPQHPFPVFRSRRPAASIPRRQYARPFRIDHPQAHEPRHRRGTGRSDSGLCTGGGRLRAAAAVLAHLRRSNAGAGGGTSERGDVRLAAGWYGHGASSPNTKMDDVRRSATVLAARVRDAHAARVWLPLGHSSWASYCEAGFGISRAQAYRLLDVARALAAIRGAVTAGTEVSRTRDSPPDTAAALDYGLSQRALIDVSARSDGVAARLITKHAASPRSRIAA